MVFPDPKDPTLTTIRVALTSGRRSSGRERHLDLRVGDLRVS